MNTVTAQPYIAVVSSSGAAFDQHVREAEYVRLFRVTPDGCEPEGLRPIPPPEKGIIRWRKLADTLRDCAALLTNGIGEAPILILANHNVRTYLVRGAVDDALRLLAQGGDLTPMTIPEPPRLGNAALGGCGGGGGGCGGGGGGRRRHGGGGGCGGGGGGGGGCSS
jgi:nitrogen fixation protein NifB